jgi:hypothetical protein
MNKGNGLNLVEALRGKHERWITALGLAALGFLFLAIVTFGVEGRFSPVAFPLYLGSLGAFLYLGAKHAGKNAWFEIWFVLLSALLELLWLPGWIYTLYLSQENPGGKYDALANLPFYDFIVFFLLIFLPCLSGLMISLFVMSKGRRARSKS